MLRKIQKAIFAVYLLFFLISCQQEKSKSPDEKVEPKTSAPERGLPEVQLLSEDALTEFVTTPETKLVEGKNNVYAVSLLYAWNEIRVALKNPIVVPDRFKELAELNRSKSWNGTLDTNEIDTKVEITDTTVKARAFFNKSLEFAEPLRSFDSDTLNFAGAKVQSFGPWMSNAHEFAEIMYYKSDNEFVLKLFPKDTEHEIILFLPTKRKNSTAEYVDEIMRLTTIGGEESKNEKLAWKYSFTYEDLVQIPKIRFHYETNFKKIMEAVFESGYYPDTKEVKTWLINVAYQRTGFLLDEFGAIVESEAVVEASVEEAMPEEEEEKPKPKNMVFNKPFFIMLKHVDSKMPYFAAWIENADLMLKY